jgi:hypothetical protein
MHSGVSLLFLHGCSRNILRRTYSLPDQPSIPGGGVLDP